MPESITIELQDVRADLVGLRLSLEIMQQSLEAGYLRRSFCTKNTPISIPGTESWRGTIEELRNQVVIPESEWRRSDIEGLPIIANDDHKIVIGVVTGDMNTGLSHKTPKSKNKKGVVVKMATVGNGGTKDLFGYVPERQTVYDFQGYEFWLLLIKTDEDVVFSELSCPSVYSEQSKKVIRWSKRIIIPAIFPNKPSADVPYTPEDDFDFDLHKKIA